MGKRGNAEGSVYQRSDGRWAAAVSLPTGKRKTYYARTRQDAAKKLREAQNNLEAGLPVAPDRLKFGEFLEQWLASVASTVRPSTHRRYEQYVRVHVQPTLARVPLAKLGVQHLQTVYAERLAAGASPTSVAHLHAILHRALSQGLRWGLVHRNVSDLVDPPRMARHEMQTLSQEQARTLLEAAEGERLEALYHLALTTGIRQGELLALRWRDVDLGAATLQVRATLTRASGEFVLAEPKTRRSGRTVLLTAGAVEALRSHRARQNEERLRLGSEWDDRWDLVFANEVGRPIEAGNLLRRSFWPLLQRAGLPRIRFHDLRHSAATLLLSRNVHPKIVSEMLGHSQIGVTLDRYSHVVPTMQRAATEAMEAMLG